MLGRSRAVRAGFLTLVVTATAVFAIPSAGMADGDYYELCSYSWVTCQTGDEVTTFTSSRCEVAGALSNYTAVCIDYSGDYVYVKDGLRDGASALGEIAGGGNVKARYCRNPWGVNSWARCNFDWSESGDKDVFGGYLFTRTQIETEWLWSFSNN